MRRAICAILTITAALLLGCSRPSDMPIGYGYAETSVNAAVFRGASLTSDAQYQFAAWYDSTEHVVISRRSVKRNSGWETFRTELTGRCADAHNVISIGLDGDGYLHISWDQHSSPLRYLRSRTPYEADFDDCSMEMDNDVTYPEFHRLSDGNLLFVYRQGISGNGNLVMNRYITSEKRWERVHSDIIDGEGQRNAYWQMYVDAADNIHLSWVWRETWDVATNHDMCYAVSHDGGLSWERSDGTLYELPITVTSAEIACVIPQCSELINQTSMTADAEGNPIIATYWRTDEVPQYRIIYKDGTEWHTEQVFKRSEAFSLSGGGTKCIPISRPQIIAGKKGYTLVFRDEERGSRVSIAKSKSLTEWTVKDLTDYSVGAWEPTYDYEKVKRDGKLELFVQAVSQGDGEQTVATRPQPIRIIPVD